MTLVRRITSSASEMGVGGDTGGDDAVGGGSGGGDLGPSLGSYMLKCLAVLLTLPEEFLIVTASSKLLLLLVDAIATGWASFKL